MSNSTVSSSLRRILMAVCLTACAAGAFVFVAAQAQAGPPIPNCNRLCDRVYSVCIADGWPAAECEMKRQMCLDDCFGS